MSVKDYVYHWTVKRRPYEGWGIWTDEVYGRPSDLQRLIDRSYEIIKITKHRFKMPAEDFYR